MSAEVEPDKKISILCELIQGSTLLKAGRSVSCFKSPFYLASRTVTASDANSVSANSVFIASLGKAALQTFLFIRGPPASHVGIG